jgi:methylated-DNA-[protein]-cysteine S-methyltransferase
VPTFVRYDAGEWGVGELWLDGDTLLASRLPRPGPKADDRHPLGTRLRAYFAGDDVSFADVDVRHEGTEFEQSCVEILRALPRNEVVTYGELSALAGRPRAARAAGNFCARCLLTPVVPVHRVVSVSGLGGFGSSGLEMKRRLLELDGVRL